MKNTQTYAILGGTSGIGLALAQRLVARGDRVVIGGRSADKRATALRSLGELASAYAVDVTDRAFLINTAACIWIAPFNKFHS